MIELINLVLSLKFATKRLRVLKISISMVVSHIWRIFAEIYN